jgi:hypothetical protein
MSHTFHNTAHQLSQGRHAREADRISQVEYVSEGKHNAANYSGKSSGGGNGGGTLLLIVKDKIKFNPRK